MRNILAIAIIFILMIGICLGLDIYMQHSFDKLAEGIDVIEKNNDIQSVNDFEELWEETEKGWLMVIKHSEADEISEHVMKMKKNMQLDRQKEFALELELLKRHLEDMPEHIKLSFKNFF